MSWFFVLKRTVPGSVASGRRMRKVVRGLYRPHVLEFAEEISQRVRNISIKEIDELVKREFTIGKKEELMSSPELQEFSRQQLGKVFKNITPYLTRMVVDYLTKQAGFITKDYKERGRHFLRPDEE